MGCVCLRGCCDGGTYDIAGRSHSEDEGEWRVRAQHVIRVFAQVLEMVRVLEDNDEGHNNDTSDEESSSSESEAGSDDQFNWLWTPMCDCPVHVSVACIQEGVVYEYRIYADESDLCSLVSNITIPGTDIKRTGPSFVQWRDIYSGKVYGLNFFTESEALRFISSCFPPTYTPDTCIRHTSSRPSYVCPSPPPPISHQSQDFDDEGDDSTQPAANPHYGFDYFTSTPIPHEIEYFRPPTMQPMHTVDDTKAFENLSSNCLSLSTGLPRPTSITSDASTDLPVELTLSLPSPPSLFLISDELKREESLENEPESDEDESTISFINDPELFQTTEPLQVNKILEDILEEEEEDIELKEDISKRNDHTEYNTSISSLNNVSPEVMEQCLSDFDHFLTDIRKSQLLEITERVPHLSRQSSFTAGPPPLLPPTPPPGPMLLPQHSNPFLSTDFQNALKRLSIASSIDEDDIPILSFSSSDGNSLPPPLMREDSEETTLQRQSSLVQPPDAFSSDSGLPISSDNELHTQTDAYYRKDHCIHTIREADTRTTSSQPSETTESVLEVVNYPSSPALNEEEIGVVGAGKTVGSIKKTGWLEVKGMLVRKNRKVAMKATRRWKSHWAVLKGRYLLLHRWDKGHHSTPTNETLLDMKIDISHSLAHPVHDHIKRDHLFCLSTYNGNTYYMQTINQSAVDEWIHSIHSGAALDITGQSSKENAIEMLKTTNLETEGTIEKEKQMKNLAELQLTTVSDSTSRTNITKQLITFSENIEEYQLTIYRNRCYLASLQRMELPNPQPLLACVSKPTKATLTKVGNFSIASLHAVVNVRASTIKVSNGVDVLQSPSWSQASDSTTTSIATNKKRRQFKFFHRKERGGEKSKVKRRLFGTISEPLPSTQGIEPHLLTYRQLLEPNPLATGFGATLMIQVPDNRICAVPFRLDLTVDDILFTCCKKFGLDPSEHFLKLTSSGEEQVPHEEEFIYNLTFTDLEIAQKFIITVQFDTTPDNIGLTLCPDLRNLGSVTHAVIGTITSNSEAERLGLSEGDEVVLINDITVAHMSWSEVTAAVTEPKFTITVRTMNYQIPVGVAGRTTHFHLRDLVCPSPPVQRKDSYVKRLNELIVPMPSTEDLNKFGDSSGSLTASESEDNTVYPAEDRVHDLIKGSLEVTGLVDRWKAYEEATNTITSLEEEIVCLPPKSPQQKMLKCVSEIVESEKEHVKMLELLVDRYLEPMKLEVFLPRERIATISDSVINVVIQQKQFLGRIEELPNIDNDPENIKRLVQELSGAFMVHLDTFKQYSQFCAALHDIEDIFLHVQDRHKLEEFLQARNPKQSPSLALTSLLTKPVLRLLRYPLFLQALKALSPKESEEHQILTETNTHVTMVTEYINEIMRVTESYTDAFDVILEESGLVEFGISVRVSELQCHMTVMWLNPSGTMGRGWRKGQGPEMHCFVFNSNVMLLHVEQTAKLKRRPSKASLTHEPLALNDITHRTLLPLAQCKVNDLPDSDGVSSMWQVVQKGRDLYSQTITYILRSKSPKEKVSIMDTLQQSIQAQLALYTNISGSLSPVKSYETPSHDSHMTTLHPPKLSLLNPQNNESIDSEYELTLL